MTFFKIGMALSDGKMPAGMIAQVLEKLALSANPPFPSSEVNEKVKSIVKTANQKHSNLKRKFGSGVYYKMATIRLQRCYRNYKLLQKKIRNILLF